MPQNYFILGATSGIGLAVTKELLAQGHKVFGVGRNLSELQSLQKTFPESLKIMSFDLRKDSAQSALDQAVIEIGPLDVVFLNSGTAAGKEFKVWSEIKETLDVNIVGTTEFFVQATNYFLKENRPTCIAVNTSIAGLRGMRRSTVYSASKAYLIVLCQSVRMRLRKKRSLLKIVDIRPGFVDTKMTGGTFWLCPADKAARQIIRAIEKRKEIVYVSKRWILVAIAMRLVPRFIYERLPA